MSRSVFKFARACQFVQLFNVWLIMCHHIFILLYKKLQETQCPGEVVSRDWASVQLLSSPSSSTVSYPSLNLVLAWLSSVFHLFSSVNLFICFFVFLTWFYHLGKHWCFPCLVSLFPFPSRNHVLARFSSVFIVFHLFIIWVCSFFNRFFISLTWHTAPVCWSGSISLLSLWSSSS